MEIKRDYLGKRYTLIAEDKQDEEAIKKLNKYIDKIEKENELVRRENEELEEENKALRENVNHRAGRCADLSEENEKLKERIKELELCNLNLQKHIDKK